MLGGGLRQAGVLAAAGLYALENNIQRLAQDHANAARLGIGLNEIDALRDKVHVHTNMIFVEVGEIGKNLPSFLHTRGIHVWGGEVMRLVTHLDVEAEDIEKVLSVFQEFYADKASVIEIETSTQSVY